VGLLIEKKQLRPQNTQVRLTNDQKEEEIMLPVIRRLIVLCALLAFIVQTPVTAQGNFDNSQPTSAGPTKPNAATWYDGMIQYSVVTNCVSIIQGFPYVENGVGTYVGFLADPNNNYPSPNNYYYLHIVIAGLGNPCSGTRLYVETTFPANTTRDMAHPVYCFYDGAQISPSSSCPQTLPASTLNPGAFEIPSTDAVHGYTWPLAQGHTFEFQIPVKSSTALSNSQFHANIWAIDGNSSPWLQPQQGVYVFSSTPVILYPTPSTDSISSTYAKSYGYVYSYGLGGTAYFDLGLDTAYNLLHDPITISAGSPAWLVWDDWTPFVLLPDTLYHFRVRFAASNGQTYYGSDQNFRTLPDGQVTVGSGISSSCTPEALASALTSAKDISFNCGTLPVTITLSSSTAVASNLTIDGGNKVTLDGNHIANHFNVQSGAHLTLTQITLVNGKNNTGCGGSVHVLGNATLNLQGARLINNTTGSSGGAICVDVNGYAQVFNSLFRSNVASISGGAVLNSGSVIVSNSAFTNNGASAHGGAFENYGNADMRAATFSQNTAGVNGGGIDSTVVLTLTNSAFINNTAGYRGGGINNYLGKLTIVMSNFISNTANAYGGGITNDGGTTSIQTTNIIGNHALDFGGGVRNSGVLSVNNSTISGNTADHNGGAMENSGTLALTNNTLSGNHAGTANGGGLYWVSGSVTLINNTLKDNTAGTQGGNIYAGGANNILIHIKNTILASGSPNNCDSHIFSEGNNLESANSCGLAGIGDLVNLNTRLGTLQNNGGPTKTHALLSGSPAIDAGTNNGCPATDQRGVSRPKGIRCDIGSFEYSPKIYLPMVKR
jgi:predicted outer membrane repeat protein